MTYVLTERDLADIRRRVAAAPPLSAARRDRLRALLLAAQGGALARARMAQAQAEKAGAQARGGVAS